MNDKTRAWDTVWQKLKGHNNGFFEKELTGLDCVLTEIDRLIAWEKWGQEIVPYLREREKELRPQLAAAGLCVSGPKDTP